MERYSYDIFGEATISDANNQILTTSDYDNPYLFTARRYDTGTGLYYYRERFYKPAIGRFIQIDPLGYYDSMNLYEYCLSDPINFSDPYGLTPWGYIMGNDKYVFSRGVDSYFNDVTQSLIGVGEGVVDVGAGLLNTVLHPIQAAFRLLR